MTLPAFEWDLTNLLTFLPLLNETTNGTQLVCNSYVAPIVAYIVVYREIYRGIYRAVSWHISWHISCRMWPRTTHAQLCLLLTPNPSNLCTGTCTPNLIPLGRNLRLHTTPLPSVPTFWTRRFPNDIRAKCVVEGVLVRPPNDKMGVERGAVCVCVRVGACGCGHLSSNWFTKQVVYY